MTLQVNVMNDGSQKRVRILDGVDLPSAKRERKASKVEKFPFNDMVVGKWFVATDAKKAQAAIAKFNKAEVYAPARERGKLVSRSLKKHPETRATMAAMLGEDVPETAYGVWMVPNDTVEETTTA